MNAEKSALAMTYGGSGAALWFGWDVNMVGMVAGVLIGLAGLALSWYFKRRQDRREQAEHDWRMKS